MKGILFHCEQMVSVCPGTHARSECVPLFGLPARRGEALTVAPCGSLYIEGWKMQRGISPGKPFGPFGAKYKGHSKKKLREAPE